MTARVAVMRAESLLSSSTYPYAKLSMGFWP